MLKNLQVRIITCHDVYNAGASLQTFALSYYLKSRGTDVAVIDYKPDYLSGHYRLWGGVPPRFDKLGLRLLYQLAKLPARILAYLGKKKARFDAFRNKYIPLTPERFASYDALLARPPHADVYIAGSDQIWNTLFKNGKDPAFYLAFAPASSIRLSYAASFATPSIAPEYQDFVHDNVKNLDFVSVREISGLNILHQLGIEGAEQVLDPVFLLNRNQWEALEEPVDTPMPYILLYDFDHSKSIEHQVKRIAKEKNAKIYSIFPSRICDKCFSNASPGMFLYLIRHAEFVVSNSFHATAFALIYERPFIVLDRHEDINTRMRDLIQLLGIDFSQKELDYPAIRAKLEHHKKRSEQFLSKALQRAKPKGKA